MTNESGSNRAPGPDRAPAPGSAAVYLLYDQGHVLSVHASADGAEAARGAAAARAKQELAKPELEYLVDRQVTIVEQPLAP